MITLTPPMGGKPHFLLCGQIGRLPTNATRTNTARIAIRNIVFLLSFDRADLGSLSGATEKLRSLKLDRKQRYKRVNSQSYAQRNIGDRQNRRNESEPAARPLSAEQSQSSDESYETADSRQRNHKRV